MNKYGGIGKYGYGWEKRGPYGTNEGDKWLAPGSDVQNRLDAENKVLIHEMMVKDGELQECMYVVDRANADTAELLAEAEAGHPRYVAAQAAKN